LQFWKDSRAAMRIIAIDAKKRNHYFGSKLLALCENWLKMRGIKSLHVESSPQALDFYRKNGYNDMAFDDPDGYNCSPKDTPLGKILNPITKDCL